MRTVVIGSGLAAVGSIRALLKHGHRPVVLDIGERLPLQLRESQSSMASRDPHEWSNDERTQLARNDGVPGRVVPRKLVFGSDYFYSTDIADMPSLGQFFEGSPPWSPALGGFSVGWGGAVLPPAPSDVADWPIEHDEILRNMHDVLEGVPLSEPHDGISDLFGQIRPEVSTVLELSKGQTALLSRLEHARARQGSQQVLVGQSRLLTQADEDALNQCRHCGQCSSGCVYGSIYTAEQDMLTWIRDDRIEYRKGVTVFRVSESANSVRAHFTERGSTGVLEADRIFLAAGAVNTSRILLNSSPEIIDHVQLRRTGGVLQLFASISSIDLAWPNQNTQTSHFMELLDLDIGPYWSHVQLGQPNELLLRRMRYTHFNHQRPSGRLLRTAASRLVSAALNVHSSFGPTYEIQVERSQCSLPAIRTRQAWAPEDRRVVDKYSQFLGRSLRRAGLMKIPFARQDSVAAHGYHFGASFAMRRSPVAPNDTDSVGRPFGWQRVHAVDTAVLPDIPATTVGLLTMANAFRIASEAVLS